MRHCIKQPRQEFSSPPPQQKSICDTSKFSAIRYYSLLVCSTCFTDLWHTSARFQFCSTSKSHFLFGTYHLSPDLATDNLLQSESSLTLFTVLQTEQYCSCSTFKPKTLTQTIRLLRWSENQSSYVYVIKSE